MTPAPIAEPRTEDHEVSGNNLLARVKELIREGNIRKLIIKNTQGRTVLEIPLTAGLAGVVLLPFFAAVGALAALAASYTIAVERNP